VAAIEGQGGYRDMERGKVSFWDFYEGLCEKAGYNGSIRDFHDTWSDFFEGPVPGIAELLTRIRARYRIAYLSNSNEVHAEAIPRQFRHLFQPQEKFIFSHELRVAKPDPDFFRRALESLEAKAEESVFVDDLIDNVLAARAVGIRSYQFTATRDLEQLLEHDGLL
jgi:putative hydrolase of the HAD superfamily